MTHPAWFLTAVTLPCFLQSLVVGALAGNTWSSFLPLTGVLLLTPAVLVMLVTSLPCNRTVLIRNAEWKSVKLMSAYLQPCQTGG